MKKIVYALLVLFSFNVNAKEVVVTAYGEGENYDWAVMNAVENAVRQTANISLHRDGLSKVDVTASVSHKAGYEENLDFSDKLNIDYQQKGIAFPNKKQLKGEENIKSGYKAEANETVTASFQDNSKEILAQYSGVVSSYEVLEHLEENGKHKVKIKATVTKEDIYDSHDYKSKDLIKKSNYSLAVMPFKISGNVNCLGQKINVKSMNETINNLFIEKFAPSRKFNLLDRSNLDNYAAEMSVIENDMTLPENKIKLKNLVTADYILVGTIDNFTASTAKNYIELTGETNYSSSSKLRLSYRILETATMEIVSAGSIEKKFNKEGRFSSCDNVKQLLFERAISAATDKILSDIFPDYQPVKKVKKKKTSPQKVSVPEQDYSLPLY